MKTFVMILALLCVSPAFAAESAPAPGPVVDVAAPTAPACSPVAAKAVPSPQNQNSELPSWLTAKPLLWSPESEIPTWLSGGCAAYCRDCGGCCAILGPNSCACC
ncbi:MAG: hypothetical protein ABIS20_21360 [Thermoanaerobaculia bacterium]